MKVMFLSVSLLVLCSSILGAEREKMPGEMQDIFVIILGEKDKEPYHYNYDGVKMRGHIIFTARKTDTGEEFTAEILVGNVPGGVWEIVGGQLDTAFTTANHLNFILGRAREKRIPIILHGSFTGRVFRFDGCSFTHSSRKDKMDLAQCVVIVCKPN